MVGWIKYDSGILCGAVLSLSPQSSTVLGLKTVLNQNCVNIYVVFPYILLQIHSEEVELLNEEEREENEASVTEMDFGLPETESSHEESEVVRDDAFVEADRTEDATEKLLKDRKVKKKHF